MPRKKLTPKRINIYLDAKSVGTAEQIDNLSKFVQLCLTIAPDVMAWAILLEEDPTTYKARKKNAAVRKQYNKKYPMDERVNRINGKPTQRPDQSRDQETNPILL